MKNSFYIKSLGCKTNHIEGQLIQQELIKAGYEPAKNQDLCDFFILNTCSVTSHADNQALYIIKQFKLKNRNAKIILTGCFAQTAENKEALGADIILGNDEKLEIVKYLEYAKNGIQSSKKEIYVEDIFSVKEFHHKSLEFLNTTRPSIKIQEGCSNRCSYCIIPYARGNSRSESIENVIKQVNHLAKNGYKEVVFVGIHIGEWGREFNQNLLDLLKKIEDTEILRYRLGSLYVTEIDEKMIDFLKQSEKFCPHFHLSLQSMCDKTLKSMNRFYNAEYAKSVIYELNKNFSNPFLGCDIITGFPGESEEDFEITYKALESSGLSFIHSFPYSRRKGTPACNMPNQVYEHVKKERTKKLIRLSENLHSTFLSNNKNTIQEVLFQKKSAKNGKYLGVTRNYIKLYKESDESLWNCVQNLNLRDYEIE